MSSNIEKVLIVINALSIAIIVIFSSISPGYQVKLEDSSETLEIINTSGYGPLLVKMNSTLIVVEGAICSCGVNHEGYSRHGHVEFENYCPFCKEYGVLIYHNGWYKGTNVNEGEFSCTKCGADFCAAPCSYEKSGSFRASLIKS